jgi:hypothetical protein
VCASPPSGSTPRLTIDATLRVQPTFNACGTVRCMCYLPAASATPSFAGWAALPITLTATTNTSDMTIINNATPHVLAATGDLNIHGTFPASANGWTVSFVGGVAAAGNAPTCGNVYVIDDQVLTCTAATQPGTSGVWSIIVTPGNKQVLDEPTTPTSLQVTLLPPAPTVTAVAGPCATESNLCVNNALLTIVGTNFDYVTASNNKVLLQSKSGSGSALDCTVNSANATTLVCKLNVEEGEKAVGDYTMLVELSVAPGVNNLVTTASGTLTFGGGAAPGWAPSGSDTPSGPAAEKKEDHVAWIVAGVCAGVVVLVVAVGLYVRSRYAFKRLGDDEDASATHGTVNTTELDYLQQRFVKTEMDGV